MPTDSKEQKALTELQRQAFFFSELADRLKRAETDEEVRNIRRKLKRYRDGDENVSPNARWAWKMLEDYAEE